MSRKLEGYILSQQADYDLEGIFDYTKNYHSLKQAIKYLNDLDNAFLKLMDNHQIGRPRNEIRVGLFSISEQEHIIFYRIENQHVRIVRVIHGSKDMPRHFK